MLNGLRALDLTDEKGFLCGKILAELGADVIKVERPGGDPARNMGPFLGSRPDPEKSLYWFAYNTSKRGVTLNLETMEGKHYFLKLVEKADFLLESFPPGHMDSLGLGYRRLSKINPGLILTSITPYGQTGPYKDLDASDISLMAMSGLMKITGYFDRPPLRLGLDQSYCLAGTHGATGSLFALHNRHLTGKGQHVDVSMYECVVLANYWEPVRWEFEGRLVDRIGDRFSRGKGSTRQVWRCKDGFVTWTMMGGRVEIERLKAIIARMDREGMAGFLRTVDLDNVHISRLSDEDLKPWEDLIAAFFLEHTKEELARFSKEEKLTLSPVNDIVDVFHGEQTDARGYWEDLEYPELGTRIRCPGLLYRSSEMETHARFRAPRIGEHNREIFEDELGLSHEGLEALKTLHVI